MSNQANEKLENEIVMYAKVGDFEGLKSSPNIEHHTQYQRREKDGVTSRVRKVEKKTYVLYYYTFKVPINNNNEGIQSNKEYTLQADSDFYKGFKNIAQNYVIKTRYHFVTRNVDLTIGEGVNRKIVTLPTMTYEVDIYYDKQHKAFDWCKIDLEIDNLRNTLKIDHKKIETVKIKIDIRSLPFKPKDIILDVNASDNDTKFIKNLWDNHYLLKI